jgi:hypothetical protein
MAYHVVSILSWKCLMIKLDWCARFEVSALKYANLRFVVTLATLCVIAAGTGCGIELYGPPAGAFLGRAEVYDYSPSAIQVGNLQQFWWCGQARNPNRSSQDTDTIQYASIDISTHTMTGPFTVLGETPGSWDSVYVCNPKVIKGAFNNPLGDGQNYSYAMYYVGTAAAGFANNIGVAFSNDGIGWKKYPQPVISATPQTIYYGVGQPAVYNSDHKAGIWLFYEDANAPPLNQHVEAISTDGLHFTVAGKLTANGLLPEANWGDMAYDSSTGYWYAVFNTALRNPSTTANITERGQPGVTLYRIKNASLLTGTSSWQQLKSFDTNLSGNESNFLAGLLRDQYGNVNVGPYPAIQMFTSISNPPPRWDASPASAGKSGFPDQWDIGEVEWIPNHALMTLNRYANKTVHEVTTGWIDPTGGFSLESTLGHLYESPQQGATLAFYGCKDGATDYFVSTDGACEGKRIIGIDGYGYSQSEAGLVALYRCYTGHDHFVSRDPKCEGQTVDRLLGYAIP